MRTPVASSSSSSSSSPSALRGLGLGLVLALAAPACGGDDGAPPLAPVMIPGGGVHDPGIDGVANVYVIDADDGAAIAGATVRVGDVEGTTDASGLFIAADVSGPQTVLAKATGHAAAAWIGVDGGNVTVPLARSPVDSTRPPQAQLTGTIDGWESWPSPAVNHSLVAIITYAQDRELGSRANQIQQPASMGPIPASACVRTHGPAGACTWKLNARAGAIALGMIVYDIDSRGTATTADDSSFVAAYAVKPIAVVAGVNQMNVSMASPPTDSKVLAQVDLGTPPAGLGVVGSLVGLDLGAAGVYRLPAPSTGGIGGEIPNRTLANGATYELIAVARQPPATGAAESIVIHRGQTETTPLTVGAWLPPPTALLADRTMVSFTPGPGGALSVAELVNAGLGVEGRPVMSLVFLDGSSQAALPVDFAPLPVDPMTLKVTAVATGAALDVRDFTIDDVTEHLVAAASDTLAIH